MSDRDLVTRHLAGTCAHPRRLANHQLCTQPSWEKTAAELANGNGNGVDHILKLSDPETYGCSFAATFKAGVSAGLVQHLVGP
jgi:hypothetical protein